MLHLIIAKWNISKVLNWDPGIYFYVNTNSKCSTWRINAIGWHIYHWNYKIVNCWFQRLFSRCIHDFIIFMKLCSLYLSLLHYHQYFNLFLFYTIQYKYILKKNKTIIELPVIYTCTIHLNFIQYRWIRSTSATFEFQKLQIYEFYSWLWIWYQYEDICIISK